MSLVDRFTKRYPHQLVSRASKFFQRWITGEALISAIPLRRRSLSSARDFTRMCRRKVRAIFPNRVSTILSQEPCLGVSAYWQRLGCLSRNVRVSLERCAEWLSNRMRIVRWVGYQASRSRSRAVSELSAPVTVLHARRDVAVVQVQRRQN